MKIEAQCECGKLRFESNADPVMQLSCHCLDCQDALKSDFADIAFFLKDDVEVSGDYAEKTYTGASGARTYRQYCTTCEMMMFDRSDGFPTLLGVMIQRIQPPFSPSVSCHVFVRNKRPHVQIVEGIKQYDMGIV